MVQGAWLWDWKDRIDRQWMDKYGKDLAFGDMQGSMARSGSKQNSVSMEAEALAALSASKMRCGGCGSKVQMHTLPQSSSMRLLLTLSNPNDTNMTTEALLQSLALPRDAEVHEIKAWDQLKMYCRLLPLGKPTRGLSLGLMV